MSATDLPPPGSPPPPPPMPDAGVVPPPVPHGAAAPPAGWGAAPVGTGPIVARGRASVGWSVAALVGCVLSMVGTFLPLVSVNGRSFSRTTGRGIDMVVPWQFFDHYKGTLLFERWDIAFALLFVEAIAAVLLLAMGHKVWPAAVGALLGAVAFHLQLSMVQRAELFGIRVVETPTYELGGILVVLGAFLALVSFVVVLAKRH